METEESDEGRAVVEAEESDEGKEVVEAEESDEGKRGTDPHSCPGLDRRKTCTHNLCGAKLHTACSLQQHVQKDKKI